VSKVFNVLLRNNSLEYKYKNKKDKKMAKQKGESVYKEVDGLTAAENSKAYKANKKKDMIANALKKPGVKEEVMDFIFSGKDSDMESPLAEIHEKFAE